MGDYSTKNWIIGLLVGAWVATFIVGYLHEAGMLSEPANPLIHTFRDWIIVTIPLLPISYGLASKLPS